jgi:four helix bundle protein
MRDYRKLKVFALADELVADVYVATRRFPPEERIGLQAQLRKAAVAVPASIVTGCERSSESEYIHFNGVALSSAAEARYLLHVANRLGYLAEESFREIEERYGRLVGGLHKLIQATRDGKRGDGQKKFQPRNADNPEGPRPSRPRDSYAKRRDDRDLDPLDD